MEEMMVFDLGPEPLLLRCAGVFASPQVDVPHRRFSLFSSFPPADGCRGSENETAAARAEREKAEFRDISASFDIIHR